MVILFVFVGLLVHVKAYYPDYYNTLNMMIPSSPMTMFNPSNQEISYDTPSNMEISYPESSNKKMMSDTPLQSSFINPLSSQQMMIAPPVLINNAPYSTEISYPPSSLQSSNIMSFPLNSSLPDYQPTYGFKDVGSEIGQNNSLSETDYQVVENFNDLYLI